MPLQGQSLRGKDSCISTYRTDVDRAQQPTSIGLAIEPLYLRVFHRGVSLKALALVFRFHGVKRVSLTKGQPRSVNLYNPQKLTQVTDAKPQKPPAIATDKGDVGELLPCSLTSICLVLSYVEK